MARPRVTPEWEPGSPADVHASAFVSTFVLPKYRERLRQKPHELLDRLYHDIEIMVDLRKAIPVLPAAFPRLLPAVKVESRSTEAVYLGDGYGRWECGEMAIQAAFEAVSADGGAIASVEPGRLAYCRGELPYERQFVLASDAEVRERLRRAITLSRPDRG